VKGTNLSFHKIQKISLCELKYSTPQKNKWPGNIRNAAFPMCLCIK